MSETKANRPDLPVPLSPAEPRPSLARTAPAAAFVSQLIAAHDRMLPQRERRTGTIDTALGAYNRGASMGVRRLPQGYRKSLIA